MKKMPIVFIHFGDSNYLYNSLMQAKITNPDTTIYLIGDDRNNHYDFINHCHRDGLISEKYNSFIKYYKHMSPNGIEYELICFLRWYLLLEFMEKNNIQKVFYMDSDVLLFTDINQDKFKNFDFATVRVLFTEVSLGINSCGHCSFLSRVKLQRFCDFMNYSYQTQQGEKPLVDIFNEIVTKKIHSGISDMTLFELFNKKYPSETQDININYLLRSEEGIFNNNLIKMYNNFINGVHNYESINELIKIYYQDGIPYGFDLDNKIFVKFNALHFQGLAKQYIGYFQDALDHAKDTYYFDYTIREWVKSSKSINSTNQRIEVSSSDSVKTMLNPHSTEQIKVESVQQGILSSLGPNNDSIKQSAEYQQREIQTLLVQASKVLQKGDSIQAEELLRQVIQREPKNFTAIYNLSVILYNQGKLNEAFIQYQVALTINPNHVETLIRIGQLFHRCGKISEARDCYQRALAIAPNMPEVYNMLGAAYAGLGRANDTITCYRKAIQLNPDLERVHSILLLALNYSADIMPEEIFAEHKRWARKHALFPIIPHTNNNDATRKIRVGYISQDFRRNSVGYFIEPIISAHDRSRYQIFCYSNVIGEPDSVTEKFSQVADQWRDIRRMSDEDTAELIRQDGIDILVDLTGHTGHNSILVSAHKPAPVQVTWLGYANTTGLAVVDYRITDHFADPVGMTERYFTEELVRMPHTFICYSPPDDSPIINQLPALANGYITFGSFNILAKITPQVIATWSMILRRIPTAKLLMKDRSLSDDGTRKWMEKQFAAHGITAERLEMIGFERSFAGHLAKYHQVDIVLDPYPYNGTTNTFDALWMGAPVITLAGNMHASRVGVSILSNLGLTAMIADSEEKYVEVAVGLANSLDYLQQARAGLRKRVMGSPLMDARNFTQVLEEKYRTMWEKWCQRH